MLEPSGSGRCDLLIRDRLVMPLEARSLHANDGHRRPLVRTIAQVESAVGLIGPGELGGGRSAEASMRTLEPHLIGRVIYDVTVLRTTK